MGSLVASRYGKYAAENNHHEIASGLTGHDHPLGKRVAHTLSLGTPSGCVEIIVPAPRCRLWTAAEKVRMVAETFEPDATLNLVTYWLQTVVSRTQPVDP
jgi:hypothetical protein